MAHEVLRADAAYGKLVFDQFVMVSKKNKTPLFVSTLNPVLD